MSYKDKLKKHAEAPALGAHDDGSGAVESSAAPDTVTLNLTEHPLETRIALHRTLRKMRKATMMTGAAFDMIEHKNMFGQLLDKVKGLKLSIPVSAQKKVGANGDFLKWLLSALWTNREAILAFVKEIIAIFMHGTAEADMLALMPMLAEMPDEELVDLFNEGVTLEETV